MPTGMEARQDSDGDRGPLVTLFNSPARVKIIEAFVSERGRDLTVSDVARLADTARSTVYRNIEELEALGVIEHTRDLRGGQSAMYQLNEDSEIADLCHKLEGLALKRLLELDGELDA